MMSPATLRLVLVVSCAHALVHVFELSLPSIELQLARDYGVDKGVIGLMSTTWRIPWGLGALGAGWLVDRYGSRRMLAIYLLGCAVTCVLAGLRPPLPGLFVVMFGMGLFASIYHPAGLALISHETTDENRTRALGLHGILGSAGIGSAPFLAALMLAAGLRWPQYFWVLAVPGSLLGLWFARQALHETPISREAELAAPADDDGMNGHDLERPPRWSLFFTLTGVAVLQGFVYSGVLSFLPRYLSSWEIPGWAMSDVGRGATLAGLVMFVGCIGQYLAGRVVRAHTLEPGLTWITLGNVPCLVVMAFAEPALRPWAAGSFALVHFMHQPVYNSLIARYTPRRRRSLCYGFSVAMGLGVGSVGATFHGFSPNNRVTYLTLAAVATSAAVLSAILWQRSRRT